jgi:uncharacterized protein YqgV (UPF0045/DUF77 family)
MASIDIRVKQVAKMLAMDKVKYVFTPSEQTYELELEHILTWVNMGTIEQKWVGMEEAQTSIDGKIFEYLEGK